MWQNGDRARTWGAEIATSFSPLRRWKLNANYSWMNVRFVPGSGLIPSFDYANSAPRHQVQLRSGLDLTRKLTFDTSAYYVSALSTMGVPSYIRLDARLGWRVTSQLELGLLGQNLLDGRHSEFLPDDYVVASQIRRAFLIRLLWIF
jgi:iron complex outermembrane receptor protein